MPTFIRCPECGFCIGKYMEFITKAKSALYNETVFANKYKDYNAEKMAFTSGITPSLEELFDACQIVNRCCRVHIVAKTNFTSVYR